MNAKMFEMQARQVATCPYKPITLKLKSLFEFMEIEDSSVKCIFRMIIRYPLKFLTTFLYGQVATCPYKLITLKLNHFLSYEN